LVADGVLMLVVPVLPVADAWVAGVVEALVLEMV